MDKKFGLIALVVIFVLAMIVFFVSKPRSDISRMAAVDGSAFVHGEEPLDQVSDRDLFRFSDFAINLNKPAIPLDEILSGGPGKDGIPALDHPSFISVPKAEEENLEDDVTGIFVDSESGGKFYPYTILVWHEIVNDVVDDTPIAVTFCPLCGSAIVYNRRIGGEVLEFSVSGFLWESNMVMYNRPDRNGEENFWSQSRGDQIVGSHVGTKLTHHPMRLLSFEEIKKHHPNAHILSQNTGHARNYGFFPYGNYDESERLIFQTSEFSDEFHPKEMFYIVPHGEISLALQESEIPLDGTSVFKHNGETYTLTAHPDGSFEVSHPTDGVLPGNYEMWFSWAIHHEEDGVVWEATGIK